MFKKKNLKHCDVINICCGVINIRCDVIIIHRDVIKAHKSVSDNTRLTQCASPALIPAFPIYSKSLSYIYTPFVLMCNFRQGSVIVEFLLLLQGDISLDQVGEIFREGILATEYTIDPDSIAFAGNI